MNITEDSDFSEINAAIEGAIDEAGIVPTESEDAQEQDQEADEVIKGDAPEVDEATDEGDPDTNQLDTESDEAKAREKGWRPKEEFAGNPDDWVDAKEFVRRQPLYDRLNTQSKEVKRLQKTLEAVVKYQKDQEAKIREKVIAELESKKREAVKYADETAFDAAEAELKRVQEEKGFELDENTGDEEPPPPAQPEIPTFVTEFAKTNPWFETDQAMTAVMVDRTRSLVASGVTLEKAISQAKEYVKSEFPHKFSNPKKDRPSAVMSGSRAGDAGKGKISESDLTPEQKDVMHFYIRTGTMTKAEFLKSLETV